MAWQLTSTVWCLFAGDKFPFWLLFFLQFLGESHFFGVSKQVDRETRVYVEYLHFSQASYTIRKAISSNAVFFCEKKSLAAGENSVILSSNSQNPHKKQACLQLPVTQCCRAQRQGDRTRLPLSSLTLHSWRDPVSEVESSRTQASSSTLCSRTCTHLCTYTNILHMK